MTQQQLIGGIGLLPATEEKRVVRDLIYVSFLFQEEKKALLLMRPEFKGKARTSLGKIMADRPEMKPEFLRGQPAIEGQLFLTTE
uniref:Uncharacterized protein n=1 Tax=Thermogemmatispora argillosa TaxID=2045280 RepID=A0A455T086_9CHLR|nr:hypothetical protein KTA_15390 [Thermogemmatispora argillosa]